MKVLYLDLNPLNTSVREDYSINPKRYGGGAIFARWMKEFYPDNFKILAHKENFDNLSREENNNQLVYSSGQQEEIISGEILEKTIPECKNFDIIFSHNPSVFINSSKKQATWCPGYLENINIKHQNVFLYNDYQSPKFDNKNIKFYKFTLSPDVPDELDEDKKEDYLFYCGRICDLFSSIETVEFCNRQGIKCYFSGPIEDNYSFLHHIDNKNTFYLGQISEETKKFFIKKSKAMTFFHKWPTPMNLTAIQCLGYGTPIISFKTGFFESIINNGQNGYLVNNESDILKALLNIKELKFKEIRQSVYPKFTIGNMTNEIYKGLKDIYES